MMEVGDHAVEDASLYFVQVVERVLQVAQVGGYGAEDLVKTGGY